jgi:uncharacterized protein YkwD
VPRRMGLVGLALAAFMLVPAASAVACEGAEADTSSMSRRAYARTVECVMNAQRAANGLAPLSHDSRLARAAWRFSRAMVAQQFFDHVSPTGSTLGERARAAGYTGGGLAETIGWGSGSLATPAAIVDQWLQSPPHRAILLSGEFRRVGLGVASGSPAGIPAGATVTADFGA